MAVWDADRVASAFNVSRESSDRLGAYASLLVKWQARINLVSPSTLPDLWGRHMADSLQLLALLPAGCATIADLGSGAGFPALPLAICAGLEVHFFESNGKKAAFLREAARLTGVRATVHQERIESVKTAMAVGCVTARALAPLPLLLAYAEPWFRVGAKGLFLKGQDVDAELKEATKSWKLAYKVHPSLTDSQGAIIAITSAERRL